MGRSPMSNAGTSVSSDVSLTSVASVTGQGIHTDGSTFAAILILERHNMKGALNSFYSDLAGEKTLFQDKLEEGDAVF